jgi:hypothetical protein
MNLIVAGIAAISVGLSGIAFRQIATRFAKDGRYDWCRTGKVSWMDNNRWYVFEAAFILVGAGLLVAGIVSSG